MSTSPATLDTRLRSEADAAESGSFAFVLFCMFVISYFLRLTARMPALGALHFDLLIALSTFLAILFGGKSSRPHTKSGGQQENTQSALSNRLLMLIGYVFLTLPFVEWPGSVLTKGLEPLIKALSFYLFVIKTVDTTKRLKILVAVYIGCQSFRILEPLYLHLTSGYWGSFTSLGNWEYMDRLSGSPYDIINPNGLGFVIVITLPLLHYLCPPTNTLRKAIYAALVASFLYTLVLSASRSAFLAIMVMGLLAILRSKHKATLLVVAILGCVATVPMMTDLQKERYLSIFFKDAKGAATAEGRVDGVMGDLKVAMRRPFFGHGLGTSREANANFRGEDALSHNLYTEVAQELGFIGLILFLSIITAIVRNCRVAKRVVMARAHESETLAMLGNFVSSLLLLVWVYLFFSFASYGMSEPYWYVIAGLSTAAARLAIKFAPQDSAVSKLGESGSPRRAAKFAGSFVAKS